MPLSDTRRRLVGRLHRRKSREREGLVLVEGARAVEEALSQGARSRFVLCTPGFAESAPASLVDRLSLLGDVQEIAPDEMQEVAGTEAPQGILMVAQEPRLDPTPIWADPQGRMVILDGVQDPGNVGTLVRVAAAFGCSALIALEGTADVWSPKALRASAGTAFRMPVLRESWDRVRERLAGWPGTLLFADAGGQPVDAVTVTRPWALVMGGEGGGCRPEVRDQAHLALSIPMPGGVESLNVGIAGALLLHDLTRGLSSAPTVFRNAP